VHLKFASAEWRSFGWSLFCHDFTKTPTDHLRQLRICGQKSLGRVRAVWHSCLTASSHEAAAVNYAERFKSGISKAITMRTTFIGSGRSIARARSAGPAGLLALLDTIHLS
jgi:hypothetical protein